MENTIHELESLLGQATQYGKTSIELIKLQSVDKISDGVSSFFPSSVIVITLTCVMFFANAGAAFWLGELLGKIYFGFFAVAGFYAFVAFILRVFMYKWMRRMFYDFIVRKLLRKS